MNTAKDKTTMNRHEHAQAMILVAIGFLVLLAFVGLTTDVGQLFIYMGHLRQAVDSASLAASGQYREGRTISEMQAAAEEAIELNGIDPNSYTVTVETCETNPGDSQLCTNPPRKLIRVTGQLDVPTVFLQLVGINTIRIHTSTISEAASLDVVLVIDVSESMGWDAPKGDPMRDPSVCNAADPGGADGFPGECQPFEEVKKAAATFIERILDKPAGEEQDRLAIVTFSTGWDPTTEITSTRVQGSGWYSDRTQAINLVKSLKIYQPLKCGDEPFGPCLNYDGSGNYSGMYCRTCSDNDDWSYYTTTNIGGGLRLAGNMFAQPPVHEEALWVVILLTDGMANATDSKEHDVIPSSHPFGFCPENLDSPLCVDQDVTTRHHSGNGLYDAEDYARDMADFVACPPKNPPAACNGTHGQGAIIFTIGLGNEVLKTENEIHNKPYGASLLRYIARVGYSNDPDPAKDPCNDYSSDYTAWCGNYYFSPTGPQLTRIFEDIASRIYTRLVH